MNMKIWLSLIVQRERKAKVRIYLVLLARGSHKQPGSEPGQKILSLVRHDFTQATKKAQTRVKIINSSGEHEIE
jgi:hypothetical protein